MTMTFASIGFGFNTILIKFTKWIFLAAGVFVVGTTLAWPYVGSIVGSGTKIQVESIRGEAAKSALTMLNTQILGRDKEHRPVEIKADQATPSDMDFTQVGLEMPKANLDLGNGETLAVQSTGGTFDRNANQLILTGDVKLTSTGGYDLQTEEAKVSLLENSFQTDKAVKGFGPTGTMEAEGMEVDQNSGKIILKGKSKLVFDMKAINQQKSERQGAKPFGAE